MSPGDEWSWERSATFSEAIFDEPLTSDAAPWYPTAADALQELLYGRTRSGRAFDWGARLVIDLPYGRAFIEASDFVEDQGLVVNVAESAARAAASHILHAVWQFHPSSSELGRRRTQVTGPGQHTIQIGGIPIYWSVALLDSSGELVDGFEQNVTRMGRKLTDPDKSAAEDAVDELRAVVQLRVALQHKTTTSTRHPHQETALARLGLDFPANPSLAWETVRWTVVDAVAVIRRALRAQLN